MDADTRIEKQNDRDLLTELTENELDRVIGGATTQLLSNLLRMMADIQKAIISNVR